MTYKILDTGIDFSITYKLTMSPSITPHECDFY